jgi:acetolactate synthase-1/2/3 large subunit
MSAGELETLARLSIPAVIIHFNNASFGWIKALQKIKSRGRYFSVDFTAGDPALVAQGFGLTALRAETGPELEDALDQAFQVDGPVFVDVKTESPHIDIPPVYCWQKRTGKIE